MPASRREMPPARDEPQHDGTNRTLLDSVRALPGPNVTDLSRRRAHGGRVRVESTAGAHDRAGVARRFHFALKRLLWT
jgi:hypothetical protein